MKRLPSQFSKYGDFEAERGQALVKLSKSNGKTVVNQLRTHAPLLVQRALYPERDLPGFAHVYLMSSAGGILQGDRMEIDIDAGENTAARITTQAATKIYRMDRGFATQSVTVTAGAGSYLEVLPHQLIPFKSSRFYQDVSVRVAPDATVLLSEIVCAGRTAAGENFEFEICHLRMNTCDLKGQVLFSDVCSMEPEKMHFDLLFGGKTIWSTIYVITARDKAGIESEITKAIESGGILAGCSKLPHDCGLFVRILDDSIDRVMELGRTVVNISRKYALLGRS
ncbi:MAG: urease accessory protein UreD [Nitrososphaera sp.]